MAVAARHVLGCALLPGGDARVGLALVAWIVLERGGSTSIVDLLLLAYAMPIQFVPVVLLGLYWPRANRRGAELGLAGGLVTVVILFTIKLAAPELYAAINPLSIELGLPGLAVNLTLMIAGSLLGERPSPAHLARFELEAPDR